MELVQMEETVGPQPVFCLLLRSTLDDVPLLVWADLGTCAEGVLRWLSWKRETS